MDIRIYYGDDRTYRLTLKSNGTAINAVGWKIYFTIKRSLTDPDTKALLNKVLDFSGPSDNAQNGIAFLNIDDSVTKNSVGQYKYNMRIIDNNDHKQSTKTGNFYIESVVNKDGE